MVNSYLEVTLDALTDTMPCTDDPLTELPGYALRRAANAMMADLAGRLAALDLRISEASVLQIIADRTDLTSSDIGRILDIQRANMVPLLGRLEAAALIRRQPIDRKSQAVVLTERGQARLSEVRRVTAQFEDDLMARIPASHRDHFLPALRALTD
jgi:DNA-binding MarR family transcriptional regulator